MDPPDRAALVRFGDAAGDRAHPQRAVAEAPRPVLIAAQLFQLHPVPRPVRRDAGDLLSTFERRFLAYYLLPPLRSEATGLSRQSTVKPGLPACIPVACRLSSAT